MSSKRRRRKRECTGKRRFDTRGEAADMIAWLAGIGKLRPGTHIYPCPFGDHYHIGRNSRGLRRRRVKAWQWNAGI